MDNFDLRKYLAEGRLLKEEVDEGRMKDPSRSIKMGKYPQVSSDTPVPMNVKYLTTNGKKLTMKVQAKNRKEAVDAVKSKDSNFKAEIKTDFVYDKDGNKLIKEYLDLEIDEDEVIINSYSGEYSGFIEDDGTVDFSVNGYEEEREDGEIDFDEDNWKDILGPKHAFVKISNQIPTTKVEALDDYVMITVDLEDLKAIAD